MILNAPSFFNSVFAMVKPMLNEATKKKIDLLPVANVGQEMLKVIPSGHLPQHYGGTGEVRKRGSCTCCRVLASAVSSAADTYFSLQMLPLLLICFSWLVLCVAAPRDVGELTIRPGGAGGVPGGA